MSNSTTNNTISLYDNFMALSKHKKKPERHLNLKVCVILRGGQGVGGAAKAISSAKKHLSGGALLKDCLEDRSKNQEHPKMVQIRNRKWEFARHYRKYTVTKIYIISWLVSILNM